MDAEYKDADQPSYLRSLRNLFFVRSLERTLAKFVAWKIHIPQEKGFLASRVKIIL